MGLVSDVTKDVYNGLKSEFKTVPWTLLSVVALWVVAWAVYIFVYPTIARSEEVVPINNKVHNMEIKGLDREILAVYTQRCQATQKAFLTDRLLALLRDYRDLTNSDYPVVPSCQDLQ